VNNDTVSSSHDVAADNGSFDSGTMVNGARFSFTYQTRGTFPYHCARHPGMVGTVVVQ
jgi:plastocyanin